MLLVHTVIGPLVGRVSCRDMCIVQRIGCLLFGRAEPSLGGFLDCLLLWISPILFTSLPVRRNKDHMAGTASC